MDIDTERGVLVMSIPDPSMDEGSLKTLSKGKTSRKIMNEIRREEFTHEAKSSKRRGK
ncbi:MAG: hypothetical protein ACYCPP_02725 [Nitrososphaerales archaeon]